MDLKEQLAPLEDACTVVLLRDGAAGLEVLMLERPHASSSFGGAWVFPGGKVDAADRVGPGGVALDNGAAARVAGLREVAEETGQVLAPESLVPLSRWTPMQRIPRRFRTWFLVAGAASAEVSLNPGEHDDHAWLAPAEALRRHASAKMVLVPPTWVTLHQLQEFPTVRAALAAVAAATPREYKSHLLGDDGAPVSGAPQGIIWSGDEDYPGGGGRSGDRHRLYIQGLPWVFDCNVSPPAPPVLD